MKLKVVAMTSSGEATAKLDVNINPSLLDQYEQEVLEARVLFTWNQSEGLDYATEILDMEIEDDDETEISCPTSPMQATERKLPDSGADTIGAVHSREIRVSAIAI